ncbi:hypothetical protein [Bradyrhizobium sp. STM 3562]|uniref:hypothetical protein n=1 Tax=Bradyrhizobium sp. STM 3562 TaxID=578924 RepID=UPI00388D17B6
MQVQGLAMPSDAFSDFGPFVHDPTQILAADPVCCSGKADNSLMRRKISFQDQQSADHTAVTYHSHLEYAPLSNDPERDEARLYEIDIINMPSRFLQNHALSESDGLNETTYGSEVL